ncbi:unnamed protein product [Larinioides sclopetarius]|uniref:Uncharacterized protein n=1 Tax=Larinioides sclopetarius TaxID=280406 RepID=A0AAV1ZJL6_9ARAC
MVNTNISSLSGNYSRNLVILTLFSYTFGKSLHGWSELGDEIASDSCLQTTSNGGNILFDLKIFLINLDDAAWFTTVAFSSLLEY